VLVEIMKKYFLTILITILACLPSFASTNVVENFYLSTLYNIRNNLSNYIYSCNVDKNSCGLTKEEGKVLSRIWSISKQYSNATEIEFSKDQKKFDLGNGAYRIAVTGLKPGSKIYFNPKYFKSFDTAPSIGKLISIMVHEYGHHLGLTDNSERLLDRIGNAIELYFNKNSQTIDLKRFGLPHIKLSIANYIPLYKKENTDLPVDNTLVYGSTLAHGSVTLYTEHEALPWWGDYQQTTISSFPKTCKHRFYERQFFISNLRWNFPSTTRVINKGDYIRATADLQIYCGESIQTATLLKAQVNMYATAVEIDGLITFDWNKIRYEVSPVEDVGGNSFRFGFGFNTKKIENGGLWHGGAQLLAGEPIQVSSCTAYFVNLKNPIQWDGKQIKSKFNECTFEYQPDGIIVFDFKHPIGSDYKSGEYLFDKVEVGINNGKQGFSFSPPMKQKLTVNNQNESKPINIIKTRLLNKIGAFNQKLDFVTLELTLDRCHAHVDYKNITLAALAREVVPSRRYPAVQGETQIDTTSLSFSLFPDAKTQGRTLGVIVKESKLECVNGRGIYTLKFIIPPIGEQYFNSNFTRIYFIANDLRIVDHKFEDNLYLTF
jgi:hypothetical protein